MNSFSQTDNMYMQRCLQLARCAAGGTSPNPVVGAVIVCDGRIIGEGYHIRAGEPHAEVNAVNSVKEDDKCLLVRSTIYVSLEPCSHYGKTPPCADMIISCGIPRVVIAITDTNSQVNGGGIARLRAAGVEVVVGILRDEAFDVNRNFFTYHGQGRPRVILKWAESADGFIDCRRDDSSLPPLQVSTPLSRAAVHKLRSRCDAILVGTRTALLDNPSLDVRWWGGRSPLRLVIDKDCSLPKSLKIFDGTLPTIVFTARPDSLVNGVEQVVLDFSSDILLQILAFLHSRKVQSLLVEGGATLLQSFIDASLWDEARVERNPSLFVGEGVAAPSFPAGLQALKSSLGGNEIALYYPKNPI